jgi:Kef-type K+ transport system membrane component KefB
LPGGPVYSEVKKRLRAITLGFLAPIFFASIGLQLDVTAVTKVPFFLVLLVLVAFLTKLLGAGLPAYLMGHSRRDALAVGVGMSARGAVELVIAKIAMRAGLFCSRIHLPLRWPPSSRPSSSWPC